MKQVTDNKKQLISDNCSMLSDQKGFTLIEAVVATAVFAFVISSVIATYIGVLKIDRKTRSQRAVYDNGRFIMEFLAKEIRNGTINYTSYSGGSIPATDPDLYVKNQNNELERMYKNGDNLILAKNNSSTNLNSNGVKITNLSFYIMPLVDPYTTAKNANLQPSVTIKLELTSNYGSSATDLVKLNLQSTFSTRVYPSRQP